MAGSSSDVVYDINRTWAQNIRAGPSYKGPTPAPLPVPESDWIDFLGFKVASPIGVPAGPLLDSKWTTLAAELGFDIVTYKTIRTHPHQGHGLPNVLYLDAPEQLGSEGSESLHVTSKEPSNPHQIAITNSFGMPSMDREFLLGDIPAAQAALRPGQVLVVSVTGTPYSPSGLSFMEDFVQAARLAKEAGARIIEANLSCPNVGSKQGALYTDPAAVRGLTSALVATLQGVPLILKVGSFPDESSCSEVLQAAAQAGAKGISGINGLSRHVLAADGSGPALGPDRLTSGVCGAPIREAALEFVRTARKVIDAEGLGLTLIGVGGITGAEHAMEMLSAGADVVQSATGMMWNPGLAQQFREAYQGSCRARVLSAGRARAHALQQQEQHGGGSSGRPGQQLGGVIAACKAGGAGAAGASHSSSGVVA